jgi:parvulin-like peptidyl-prolyl isomerase
MLKHNLPWLAAIFLVFTMGGASGAIAADHSTQVESPNAVVATIGDEPIRAVEVARLVTKVARGQPATPAALAILQAQTLEEIVDRRLVLAYARRNDEAPTDEQLQAARGEFEATLARQRRSLDDYLRLQSLTAADLDRQLVWNLVWSKYLARFRTQARAEAYFRAHRRQFDGTELAVSQILLRPAAGGTGSEGATPEAVAQAIKRADAIRAEVTEGKIPFADAAKKYSAAPSAADGGRLGWIGRHGPMDEAFSQAAFALQKDQVSAPVRTAFGVALIRCDDIRPGTKSLADVRAEVDEALAAELLRKLADSQRRLSPVKYTGAIPHFRSGTREVER